MIYQVINQSTNIINPNEFENSILIVCATIFSILQSGYKRFFMKEILNTVFVIFIMLIISGCEESEIPVQENFKIEFGSECGWCAGQEFISVTNSKIEYTRNIPCGEGKGIRKKEKEISSKDWNELQSSFDYSLFKTLNYNSCNVCVDGCDEIIKITENDSIHEIRYTSPNEIEETKDLRQILNKIMEEMRD